jgi:signal transduction histidine kinase
MTDNLERRRTGGRPLETGRTDEQRTIDGLRREIAELRASRTRLASVSDAERRQIERALHEGVQQDLVGLAANLEVAAGSLDSDPAAARAILDELRLEARRALTEIQELANRIFPPLLAVGGLVAELRAAAARADVPARISVEVDVVAPPEIAGAVYFCALDVFERAPTGTPVAVSVRSEPEALVFEIVAESDLGTDRRAPHDRIEALGGRVVITSEGDGTALTGSLPLSR